ncbi:MAG TPA: TcpE family conjugal transfer membrane protein, partial [Streptosporangiaceae bacterium]|nr:TcpE family conjugal transfer membrane protein [Streptosporangiaceae bacterium]
MDLPTYTNIWRIEKRLYKLYDFRLPAPLPITWIGVFVGITVPYVIFLIAVGLPFNHNLVWLYILPPGVLTWLTTRPVIESKRLPELVSSQLRYVAEPRSWCRMAPFAEKDEILVTARVWHSHPPKARPKRAKRVPVKARSAIREPQIAAVEAEEVAPTEVRPVTARRPAAKLSAARLSVARSLVARPKAAPLVAAPPPSAAAPPVTAPPVTAPPAAALLVPPAEPAQMPVQERAPARRAPQRAKAQPEAQPEVEPVARPSWSPWPHGPEPDAVKGQAVGQVRGTDQPSAWTAPPSAGVPDARALEVAHDTDTGFRGLDETPASFGPPSWPSPQANLLPLVRPRPEPIPFPEAGPFPEATPFPEAGAFPEVGPFPEPEPEPEPAASTDQAASTDPAASPQGPASPDPGSPPRSAPWTGLSRRHLSGLMTSLVRKPDRSPGSPQPPVEDSAQATSPGRPQPPTAPARPRARWMLRAQPHPASAATGDQPAAAAAGLLVPVASATQAEAPQADTPQDEAPHPDTPQVESPEVTPPEPAPQAPIAPQVVGVERERDRPVLSIERALSGPGSRDESSWRRQVKVVVAGGQRPGKRDQEGLDRDRARLPLAGSYRIVVLGCTRGAGQTLTALMTGHVLAVVRGIPVAALDLTPSPASLAARRPQAVSVQALLAGQEAEQPAARVDVVADDGGDFPRLADMLAERYPLTMIDPAPTGLSRVLARADQLVLVAPASPDAATSLANTQQWLDGHGYGELAAHAVTVVNGVSRRTRDDVLRAESVVRGRCRAIVRVPWDDLLSSRP